MTRQTDSQLLCAYAEQRSESAFAELVRRHVDFVYSAALRMVCDSQLAQDVSQGVFLALAKNATRLVDRPALSGWLHCTARNIAAQTVRTDVRRRAREQEAAAMNTLLSADPGASWVEIAPHLDAALGELAETDRDAVLLRYFERKSASEMAQILGVSDEAAQKRVSRAVERLRDIFAKRNITIGTSGLVAVVTANAVQAAPAGLAATISTAAALAGATLATTATATAAKAIAMTTLQKAVIGATLVAVVGFVLYKATQGGDSGAPVTIEPAQTNSPAQGSPAIRRASSNPPATGTVFTRIYSPDTKLFAANLRAIKCPEETVKDIIVAEINRKYRTREEGLRPKPEDHVPFMWSPNTSERVLLERRQQAAALARDKAAALQGALGYEVAVAMPVYALRFSDQQFEQKYANLPPATRNVLRDALANYWTKVQALQDRTKGFWQAEDVAELEHLKIDYRENVVRILAAQSATPPQAQTTIPVLQEPQRPNLPSSGIQTDAPLVPATASSTKFSFDWSLVESSDYRQYAANLRTLGFPEDLLRAIVTADIDKLYAPREEPFKPKPVAYDAPLSERQKPVSVADWERIKQLRDVQIEKQAVLKEILGIYVPREPVPPPNNRNLEAFEYALSQLPVEKRDAVQIALENDWYDADLARQQLQKVDNAAFLEAYKRIREERNAVMLQHLTPEEFEQFEMNTVPAGTELARRVAGMAPTDEEFLTMFRIARDNWVETGGIYGIWRAVRVPPEEISAADERMNTRLKEALGPDRYLEYQLATSDSGQKLRNLAARYDLPREILAQAFQVQSEADRLGKASQLHEVVRPDGSKAFVKSPAPQPTGELADKLQTILGPVACQAWIDGKNLRVKLDP